MAKIMSKFECRGEKEVLEKAFIHYILSKAEKKFGRKGFNTGFLEFNQLHKRTVF